MFDTLLNSLNENPSGKEFLSHPNSSHQLINIKYNMIIFIIIIIVIIFNLR